MKKRNILLFILTLILHLNLSAQNDLKIGLNAGLNYPTLRGNELARFNNFNIGFLIGPSIEYNLTDKISLKANFNYERKVRKSETTFFNSEAEEIGRQSFRELFNYLNIPILLKYEFGSSRYFVNTGPFMNYLINSKFKPENPNEDRNRGNSTERKKFDFGLSLGIGTRISLNGNNNLNIEIRDDFGLVDTGGVPNQIEGTLKTNSIKLILNWNLRI